MSAWIGFGDQRIPNIPQFKINFLERNQELFHKCFGAGFLVHQPKADRLFLPFCDTIGEIPSTGVDIVF